MATHQLGFKPQFVDAVASGAKRQTIRRVNSEKIYAAGDTIQLVNLETGKLIKEVVLTDIDVVYINKYFLTLIIGGMYVGFDFKDKEHDDFARRDGFTDYAQMWAWFKAEYGLSDDDVFEGQLLQW